MFRYLFRTIALSLAAIAVSTPVLAAPFRTPDLDAATTWEIKPSYQWASNGFEHETGYEMDITAPIRPGLETSITFGSGTFKTRGEKAISGAVDSEWAVKWEILPAGEGDGFGISTEPALIIPTGSAGFSDDQWALEVPLVFGWNRGRFNYLAMISYGQGFDENRGEIGANGVIMWEATDTLKLGVELATAAPSDRFGEFDSELNVGFKWEFVEGLALKARIGQSLHREDGGHETGGAIYLEKAF
jgi:hypothetical protein